MTRPALVGTLSFRLAQAAGVHPFVVVVGLAANKRRRALLRQEAIRQDKLSRLARERVLDPGELDLWAPAAGTRLAREWNQVRQQLAREGVIDAP